MDQFKKNAAVIVLGVIAAAMLIGNICFVVFAKSSVKKATITKQEVKTVAGKVSIRRRFRQFYGI